VRPLLARWNEWHHFYSIWPFTRTHVLLFEISFLQFLIGIHWNQGSFAVCCWPLEITVMERGDWLKGIGETE